MAVAGSIVNLTVHGIGPTTRELDPGEDRTWVTIAQFELVLDAVVGRSDVRITFDDGNSSDLDIALPRLLERGLAAEFFLLAGRIGEPGRLDRAGVCKLVEAGMAIGSHGWAHRDWRRVNADEAHQEITAAPRVLAGLTGRPVRRVAVPFGSYDRRVLGWLRRAGVQQVYTSDGGRARSDNWLQSRNSLPCDIGPEWTRYVLDGRPGPATLARRLAVQWAKRTRS